LLARERGFRAAWRFYRANFRSVVALSIVFYLAIVLFAAISVAELGYFAILPLLYLTIVSIFWLQAPLTRLMDDVRNGPGAGVRSTFAGLYPRLGSITGGTFMVGSAVFSTAWFFVLPGLFLLARWALFIPVIVLERKGAFAALGRSNALVRRHTARVMLELVASTLYMFVVWSIAVGLLQGITSPWVSIPATVAFVAVVTPVIPLMRTLSYYDLCSRERLAADSPSAAAIASET